MKTVLDFGTRFLFTLHYFTQLFRSKFTGGIGGERSIVRNRFVLQ